MLKMTGMRLKKIVEIDMYLFIEKGLREGIPYIAERYSKSNNKYMKNCNPKKPWKFITYLDMNNLYGWAMSGYLPYGGFKWLKNVDNFDVNSCSEKSPIGCIFSKLILSIHALHNNYLLAPEKLGISYDMLPD